MASRPGGPYQPRSSDSPTKSQLFPFLGKGKEVVSKAHFIPFVVLFLMGFLLPNPFMWFLAFSLGIGTYYLVYRMCGKPIAPWVPLVPAVFTCLLLYFGLDIFDKIFSIPMTSPLPDNPAQWAFIPYPTLLYNIFVQVGLKEELIKAVPVLLCAFLIPKITSSFARPLEVREPLDGILIATGSALGFTMLETMGQYVPQVLQQSGFSAGLDLLLVRVGGDLAGHIAYSGYFGYFIGLAMMKPKGRLKTIGIGWLFASTLHAFWDSLGSSPFLMLFVGIVSYGLLGAAILKARQISPTRGDNFATQLYRGQAAPPVQPYYAGAPTAQPYAMPQQPPQPGAPSSWNATGSSVPPMPPGQGIPVASIPGQPMTAAPYSSPMPPAQPSAAQGLTFFVAGKRIPLTAGRQLAEAEMPGLRAAAGDGIVAEVTLHPTDPSIIGLRNLSTVSWTAWTPTGESRDIPSAKTIRLTPGTAVQFGNIRGEIL